MSPGILQKDIFASWLHKASISDTVIDLLQGRVGKSVLVNHYLSPPQDFKGQVLDALNNLKEEIGCC
jgi:intergrase/recombinase